MLIIVIILSAFIYQNLFINKNFRKSNSNMFYLVFNLFITLFIQIILFKVLRYFIFLGDYISIIHINIILFSLTFIVKFFLLKIIYILLEKNLTFYHLLYDYINIIKQIKRYIFFANWLIYIMLFILNYCDYDVYYILMLYFFIFRSLIFFSLRLNNQFIFISIYYKYELYPKGSFKIKKYNNYLVLGISNFFFKDFEDSDVDYSFSKKIIINAKILDLKLNEDFFLLK